MTGRGRRPKAIEKISDGDGVEWLASMYTGVGYICLVKQSPIRGIFCFPALVHVVLIPSACEGGRRRDLITGGGDMAKAKKAFGGYSISFKGAQDTLESVFGSAPIGPSDMTKKLWAYVKRKKLAGKR
jgi:hypothetical protein